MAMIEFSVDSLNFHGQVFAVNCLIETPLCFLLLMKKFISTMKATRSTRTQAGAQHSATSEFLAIRIKLNTIQTA